MGKKKRVLFISSLIVSVLLFFAVFLQACNGKSESNVGKTDENFSAPSNNKVSAHFMYTSPPDEKTTAQKADYILKVFVTKANYKDEVIYQSTTDEETLVELGMPTTDYEANVIEIFKAPHNTAVEKKIVISSLV